MEKALPLCWKHKVKLITNMGSANPEAAAAKCVEIAKKHGLTGMKIACVTGDDLLPILQDMAEENNYYYLNVAEAFADENGCLPEEASPTDGMHFGPKYYEVWFDYLKNHVANPDEVQLYRLSNLSSASSSSSQS